MKVSYHAQPAGFISRMIAFIIDLVILNLASALIIGVTSLIIDFFQLDILIQQMSQGFPALWIVITVVMALVSFILLCGYFSVFWTVIGSTPGKLFMGLRVVRQNNLQLTFGKALLRFAGYWISALPLFLGFLWVLVDGRRQGWHDKLAGTQVIYYWEKFRQK
jgi:uncharacterized RDD family membrane protein YckC